MDYDIRAAAGADDGIGELEALADEGTPVALLIAAEELPEEGGLGFLARAHALHPDARRVLVVDRGRWKSGEGIVRAMTLGRLEGILFVPWALLDQYLYPTIGDHLSDWAKERPPAYQAAHIVGGHGEASAHYLLETLTAVAGPFGFFPSDSEEGRKVMADAGIDDDQLPMILWRESRRVMTRPSPPELAES